MARPSKTKSPTDYNDYDWTEIGRGTTRKVFAIDGNLHWVVKYEMYGEAPLANMMEYSIWKACEHYEPGRKWLAPCGPLDLGGKFLLQRRVATPPDDFVWPDRIPNWLTDTKKRNFGLLDGRLVACDYAMDLPLAKGISTRMWKVNWW